MAHMLLTDNAVPMTLIESYNQLTWKRNLFSMSTLELTMDPRLDNASMITPGLELGVSGDEHTMDFDKIFFIDEIPSLQVDDEGKEFLTVRGVDVGMFDVRQCLPPNHGHPPFAVAYHTVNGPVETFLKALVDRNVGPNSPSFRRISNLEIATDLERGPSQEYNARFQILEERLLEVGQQTGMGWDVSFDPGNNVFVFDVIPGVDKTDFIVFDIDLGSATDQEWIRLRSDSRNVAYVAGQGEGDQRSVVHVFSGSSEPEGIDRREMFIDARDVEDDNLLAPRGMERLAENAPEDTVETGVYNHGPFRYKHDFDLGDIVTVRHKGWGISAQLQVVAIEQTISGENETVDLKATMGIPVRGLRRKIKREFDSGTGRS